MRDARSAAQRAFIAANVAYYGKVFFILGATAAAAYGTVYAGSKAAAALLVAAVTYSAHLYRTRAPRRNDFLSEAALRERAESITDTLVQQQSYGFLAA